MASPKISVIIPTHDRPERLGECLFALARQDYPRDAWEVVVVDDGSREHDRVAATILPFRDQIDVRLVVQDNAGPATARNRGADLAKFDYLAFTDDDCRPHPSWLSAFAVIFERTPEVVLGGYVVNGFESNLYSEVSHRLVEYVVDYFLQVDAPFFTSNNLAIPRATFDAICGFDTSFPLAAGEDRDFSAKCRHIGTPLIPAPDAVVEHRHSLRLGAFLRQHYNYGRGAAVCRHLEVARNAGDFRVEPLRFYAGLLCLPFQPNQLPHGRLRKVALLFVSQVVNAAGFFRERFRIDRRCDALSGPSERA